MNEQLKNKIKIKTEADYYEGDTFDTEVFDKDDVKSAVEWLKDRIQATIKIRQEFIDSYYKINDIERATQTELQRDDLEWCLNKINEAFPDLCPSGDLINDKTHIRKKE